MMNSRWQNNILPALMWIGAIALLSTGRSWNPLTALLLFRSLLIAGCLLLRAKPLATTTPLRAWASRIMTFIPVGLSYAFTGDSLSHVVGMGLILAGTSLVCLACIDLSRSFGIAPAIRPFVATGVYRFISHPMYFGHVITEAGMLIIQPTLSNFVVILLSWSSYALRAKWESELIQTFSARTWTNTPFDARVSKAESAAL